MAAGVALFFAALLATASPSAGAYRPIVSDVDPELFRIDEAEYLGVKISDEFGFMDAQGKSFSIRRPGGKARILTLSYYGCDGACPALNAQLAQSISEAVSFGNIIPGEDFDVVTLSFDRRDGADSARHFQSELIVPDKLAGHWKVALLKNRDDIERFTSAIGYRFFWSAQDRLFLHPQAVFFLSPEGRVVRILHNPAAEARDIELAVIDANFNRLSPSRIVTLAVGLCYSYNFKDGKYGLNYPLFFAMGSLVTGVGAFAAGAAAVRRRKKTREMKR